MTSDPAYLQADLWMTSLLMSSRKASS